MLQFFFLYTLKSGRPKERISEEAMKIGGMAHECSRADMPAFADNCRGGLLRGSPPLPLVVRFFRFAVKWARNCE
jgi:hypothetical protein